MLLLTVACDGLLEATRVIAPSSALIYVTHGLRLSIAHPCPCTPVKALAAAIAAKTRGGGRAILPRPRPPAARPPAARPPADRPPARAKAKTPK